MTKTVTFCFDFGSPYSYLAYKNLNSIRFKCLSVHIGSQILSHKPYEKMLKEISKILEKGDTLFSIARDNNVTMKQLLRANPNIKDPNKIFAGDIIHLTK